MKTQNQILHEGELNLGGMSIPCYVLDDGTRVLSGSALQNALKMVDDDDLQKSGTRLTRHISQTSLEPFLFKDKETNHYDPIICFKGDKK